MMLSKRDDDKRYVVVKDSVIKAETLEEMNRRMKEGVRRSKLSPEELEAEVKARGDAIDLRARETKARERKIRRRFGSRKDLETDEPPQGKNRKTIFGEDDTQAEIDAHTKELEDYKARLAGRSATTETAWSKNQKPIRPQPAQEEEEEEEEEAKEEPMFNPFQQEEVGRPQPQKEEAQEEDSRTRHEVINDEREVQFAAALNKEYDSLTIRYEMHPIDAVEAMTDMIGEQFVETLNMGDNDHEFMNQYEQSPIITPTMSKFLKQKMQENLNEGDTFSGLEPTVKNESIPFHLSLIDENKIARPDKAADTLDYESGLDNAAHPLAALTYEFIRSAIDGDYWDRDGAIAEMEYRKRNRAEVAGESRAALSAHKRDINRDFEESTETEPRGPQPPYAPKPRGKGDLDRLQGYGPVKDDGSEWGEGLPQPQPPTAQDKALGAGYKKLFRGMSGRGYKASVQSEFEKKFTQAILRMCNKKDGIGGSKWLYALDDETEHYKRKQAFESLQNYINNHAKDALGSRRINTKQKLAFGREGQDSGSDSIMTPGLRLAAESLGIGIHIPINAPDIMAIAPLKGLPEFGGKAVSPTDDAYINAIAIQVAHMVDEGGKNQENLHPAISSNSEISRRVFEYTGDLDYTDQSGYDTGLEADRRRPETDMSEEDHPEGAGRSAGIGGSMGGGLGNIRVDGEPVKSEKEIAEMMTAQQTEYLDKLKIAVSRSNQNFFRTGGKRVKDEKTGEEIKINKPTPDEQGRLKGMEHLSTMRELENAKLKVQNNEMSEEEFNRDYGSMMASKGFGFIDFMEQQSFGEEIPDVGEGHFLHADENGVVLNQEQKQEKLAKFFNTFMGVHGIMFAARQKVQKAGISEDETKRMIANRGDLMVLSKPDSERTFEDAVKIDELTAAGITKNWFETRLSQNQNIRNNIKELGISPMAFMDMVTQAFGDDMSFDTLSDGAKSMLKQMGGTKGGEDSNLTIANMLQNYLQVQHRQEMADAAHHHGTIQQTQNLKDFIPDEEKKEEPNGPVNMLGRKHDSHCKGCLGNPERTVHTGDAAKRGGKHNITSPYIHVPQKVPNLIGVELGDTQDGMISEEYRGATNLISMYHDLKGFADDEDGWRRAVNMSFVMGEDGLRRNIEDICSERTSSASLDIATKYGLGTRLSQSRPRGIAKTIAENPLAREVWKHIYPASGAGKKEEHDKAQKLAKDQKNDILGALNLLTHTDVLKNYKSPQQYPGGVISQKAKRELIRALIKGSGHTALDNAERDYKKFTQDRERVDINTGAKSTIQGMDSKMKTWGVWDIPNWTKNKDTINDLTIQINNSTPEQLKTEQGIKLKEQRLKLRKRNEKIAAGSAGYYGRNNLKMGVESNRWKVATKLLDKKQQALVTAKNNFRYMPNNNHMATLAQLYFPLKNLAKSGVGKDPDELMEAINGLHQSHYLTPEGINKRERFKFRTSVSQKTGRAGVGSVGIQSDQTPQRLIQAGLRGRSSESLGSAIDFNAGGYHHPIPTDVDSAKAMMLDRGIEVTPAIEKSLEQAAKTTQMNADERAIEDMGLGLSERDKIASNQSHVDPNKKNFSNPSGGQTRCGTCAGSGEVTQSEAVSYAKAHYDDLKGAHNNSRDIKKWLIEHTRPQHHQSYDVFDALNGGETDHSDHNSLACPDCEHWDNSIGQNGGWVSDGVCGHCLGDGSVNGNDDYLLTGIENHRHRGGLKMTPENLASLPDMQQTRDEKKNRTRANLQNMLSETNPLSPLSLMLDRIEAGHLPNIHTKEELQRAREKQERASKRLTLDAVKAQTEGEGATAESVKTEREAKLYSDLFTERKETADPMDAVNNITDKSMEKARNAAGGEALKGHLTHMIRHAMNSGIDGERLSAYKVLAQKIITHQYGDFEDGESSAHDKLTKLQTMIMGDLDSTHAEYRKILGGGTQKYEDILAIENKDERDIAKSKYFESLYKKPNWHTPNLTHYRGRMMTDYEYRHRKHFNDNGEIYHHKTAEEVKKFFSQSSRGKNRIRDAFNLVEGNTWNAKKEQHDGEIMSFLQDVDGLIDKGESPMQVSKEGKLPPNKEYLRLKEEVGELMDDDSYDKDLTDSNILHPSLEEKHSESARGWLRHTGRDADGEIAFSKPLHTGVSDQIASVARKEWIDMATMRATIAFFKANEHAGSSCYNHLTNSEGEPMTLEEYKKEPLTGNEKKFHEEAIAKMITDRNGNPIDLEEGTRTKYYIAHRPLRSRFNTSGDTFRDDRVNQDEQLEDYPLEDHTHIRNNEKNLTLTNAGSGIQNKLLTLINDCQKNQEALHIDESDMSHNDALKIVDSANNFYDIYHAPNSVLEDKLHEMRDDLGLDSLSDLKDFLIKFPEEGKEIEDVMDTIQKVHPLWSKNNVTAENKLDIAHQLMKPKKEEDESSASPAPPIPRAPSHGNLTPSPGQEGATPNFANLMSAADYTAELKAATLKHSNHNPVEPQQQQFSTEPQQQQFSTEPQQQQFSTEPQQEPQDKTQYTDVV